MDDEQRTQEAVADLAEMGKVRYITPVESTLEIAESPLSDEQEARSRAMLDARIILERRGLGVTRDSVTPPPVGELIQVADYILWGSNG